MFGDTPISAGGSQAVVQTGSGEVNLTFEKFLNVSSKIRKMKSKQHPLWKDGDEGVGADAGDRDDALAADSGERREPGPHFYLEQLYLFDRTILAQTPTLHSDTHTPNFLASIPFGDGEQFFAVGDVGTGTVWHQHDSAWNAVVVGEKCVQTAPLPRSRAHHPHLSTFQVQPNGKHVELIFPVFLFRCILGYLYSEFFCHLFRQWPNLLCLLCSGSICDLP